MRTLLAFLLFAASAVAQTVGIGAGIPGGQIQLFDNNGKVAAGYKLCSYAAGSSTPQVTYSDSQLTTPNANPTVLNSAGRASVWLNSSSYKLVLRGVGSDGTCSTGTIAWTSDNISAPTPSITGGVVNVLSFGALCDGSTDDATAFATALATGANVIIPGNRTCLLGSGLTMSTTNQALIGAPGVVLKAKSGFATQLLTISGTGNTVQQIVFDANTQGTNGAIFLQASSAAQFQFLNNTVKNTVNGQYALRLDGTTDSLIQGNYFGPNMLGSSVTVFNSSARARVIGNEADSSAATSGATWGGVFAAQTGDNSTSVSDVTFQGNTARINKGFCGLAQSATGGAGTVSNITFTGNVCTVVNTTGSANCSTVGSTAKACGGWSLAQVSNSAAVGNTYHAAGQRVDIAGIELAGCTGCVADGNNLFGDVSNTASGSHGIWCDGCTQTVISNNVVNSWGAASGASGITIQTTSANTDVDDNIVTGNTVIFPNANTLYGIYVLCNQHGGATNSASRTVITNNNLIGYSGSTGTIGINLSDTDALCTLDSTVVAHNISNNNVDGTLNSSNATNTQEWGNTYLNATNPTAGGGSWSALNTQGTGAFTAGLSVGKVAAPTQKLDVAGTSSFTGTTCFSTAAACSSGDSSSSPIVEWDATSNRGRIQTTASQWDFNSVDGTPIYMHSGSQVWMHLATAGLGPQSVTFATFPSPTNGYFVYCSDCTNTKDDSHTAGAACAGSGHGALAIRENSSWNCY